ncbi:hypothetical protein [Paraburkholderia tuberum]|uniref:Uncharacterized protein n=1 Tax=Paraburkholderia tuberum TaxID=157910 RepID=A0A1H1KDJ9_9BURK|nr:hypothetical protein [Paraburkholderia tuberum]SDR60363.1 hypothetical protein SAMN05445850_7276 [Paraburkholderia tuberum]
MSDQSRTRITWLKAFWLLFKGNPEDVGKGYKWKSSLLMGALMWAIGTPFIGHLFDAQFSGSLPPEAPLIRATGQFVHKFTQFGIRRVPYVDFETDDGRHYATGRYVMDSIGLEALARREPPVHVYTEGFLLENGKGSYWPLVIRTPGGTDLIPQQRLQDSLRRARRYPWKADMVMYSIAGVFWAISTLNAYRLKKKLSQEDV